MIRFIIKRVGNMIILFLGITLISFLIIHLAPGKPFSNMEFNPKVDPAMKQKIQRLYGLDRPMGVQYADWLGHFARFDFGYSITDGQPVRAKIASRIPVTLTINIVSLFLVFMFGVLIGVSGAVHKDSWWDKMSTLFIFLFFSLPAFWIALLAVQFFSVRLGWFPVSGIKSLDWEYLSAGKKILDFLWHITLPVVVGLIGSLAGISRYTRERMLSVLREEYVTFARSKGLPERRVVYVHALRNALLPIVTLLGLSVPGLLGGSVIFESIFAIPGIGRLFYEAVMTRDYPLIMGLLSIGAILTLVGNFLADLGYSLVDPRIRISGKNE